MNQASSSNTAPQPWRLAWIRYMRATHERRNDEGERGKMPPPPLQFKPLGFCRHPSLSQKGGPPPMIRPCPYNIGFQICL